MRIKVYFIVFCVLCSCQQKRELEIPRIGLGNITEEEINMLSEDMLSVSHYFALYNENGILPYLNTMILAGETEDGFILTDMVRVLIVEPDGNVRNVIQRRGNGPQEYQMLMNLSFDSCSGNLVGFDYSRNDRVIIYGQDGAFVKEIRLPEHVSNALALNGRLFLTCFDPGKPAVMVLDLSSETVTNESSAVVQKKKTAMMMMDGLFCFDDQVFLQPVMSDTVFSVTSGKETPFFIFDSGKYAIPEESYASLAEMTAPEHIQIQDFIISHNKLFVRFILKQKLFLQIWDIEQEKLLFQHVVRSMEDDMGIPVEVDGKRIVIWPFGAIKNHLYCQLKPDDAFALMPDCGDACEQAFLCVSVR
ncbi:MAG: 6-bladed beta-propeller [Bacteroidales bacterium]|nr:6-bladed beta-propeller [Bacteroidales bacterium]